MEVNATYIESFEQDGGTGTTYFNHIYEFLDGYFVLAPYESSVVGKFTSPESAYTGAKEAYDNDLFELYDD